MVSPTGSGKTVIFSYLAKSSVEKGKKVLILTDRIELLKSTGSALTRFGLKPYFLEAGDKTLNSVESDCVVAMVETFYKRLVTKVDYKEYLMKKVDLIIIDEAHKSSFDKILLQIKLREDVSKKLILGFTATPYRVQRGGDNVKPLKYYYEHLIEVTTVKKLINEGYLAEPIYYEAVEKGQLNGIKIKGGEFDPKSIQKKYDELNLYGGVLKVITNGYLGKKILIFCVNLNMADKLYQSFVQAGYSDEVRVLDSECKTEERNEILDWYSSNKGKILINVGILTTGYDNPAIEVVVLYRPTTSLPLYMQMIGRGSRITETKKSFEILDFGENLKRLGLWEQDVKWSLDYMKKLTKKRKELRCVKCDSSNTTVEYYDDIHKKIKKITCKDCGYVKENKVATEIVKLKKCSNCKTINTLNQLRCRKCKTPFSSDVDLVTEEVDLKEVPRTSVLKIMNDLNVENLAYLLKEGKANYHEVMDCVSSYKDAKDILELAGKKIGWLYYNAHRYPKILLDMKNTNGEKWVARVEYKQQAKDNLKIYEAEIKNKIQAKTMKKIMRILEENDF